MGPFNFNFTFVRKKEKLMSKLTNYCIVTFPVASYCVHQSATVGALPRLFSDTLLPTLPDSLSCCCGFSLSLRVREESKVEEETQRWVFS